VSGLYRNAALSKRKLQNFRLLWAAFEHRKFAGIEDRANQFPGEAKSAKRSPPCRVISVSLFVPLLEFNPLHESGRFRGVRFEEVRVGLGKLLACLNLPYRLLRFINFA
jgi:hypothetical protein